VPGMSDDSRLTIIAAAEQEEARLHSDLQLLSVNEITKMIAGLRLSIIVESDPMKRAILRGAFLAAIRYVSTEWRIEPREPDATDLREGQ
jgi:hypothetical protein